MPQFLWTSTLAPGVLRNATLNRQGMHACFPFFHFSVPLKNCYGEWTSSYVIVNKIRVGKGKYRSITLSVFKKKNKMLPIHQFIFTLVLCEIVHKLNHYIASKLLNNCCWGSISFQMNINSCINLFLLRIYVLPGIYHRTTQDWQGQHPHRIQYN